jgi:hypothetical protein
VRLYNSGFDLIQKACFALVMTDTHFLSSCIVILFSGSKLFILRICVCKYQHLSLPLFWSTLCLSALHKFPSCKIWGSHNYVVEVSSPLASDTVIFWGIILLSSSVLNSPIRRAIFSGQLLIFLDCLLLKMKVQWPFQTPGTTCATTVSHPTWQMFLPNCQYVIRGCFK